MIRLRKVTYQVHTEVVDDEGRPTSEGMIGRADNGQPQTFTLFAHQLDQLPGRVAEHIAAAQPPDA